MSTIAMRRTILIRADISWPDPRASRFDRNSIGMTTSLQIIVDNAIVSTITIPVAAENPPR